MNEELNGALRRVFMLEQQVIACLADSERVRNEARALHRAQAQLHNELFAMQRRLDNYALVNAQLSRQVYPPPPHTSFQDNEVLIIDIP